MVREVQGYRGYPKGLKAIPRVRGISMGLSDMPIVQRIHQGSDGYPKPKQTKGYTMDISGL